jgi:cardiolipin synthase (CMP-forming)
MTCRNQASRVPAMFALPNALTVLRIVLVPLFVIAFVIPGDAARLVAFGIFVIAGVSDWLDGFAARKLKAGSDFGQIKPNGMLSLLKLVPALIILSREILVSGLREFLSGLHVSVPVTAVAKFKTAVQMVAIGAMILTPLADIYLPGVPSLTYAFIAYAMLWVAAALTVYTGVIYFRSGMAHLRPGTTPDP